MSHLNCNFIFVVICETIGFIEFSSNTFIPNFSLGVDIWSDGGIDLLDVDGLGEGAEEDGGDEEGAGEHLEFLSVLFIIIILIARARGHSLPKPRFSN